MGESTLRGGAIYLARKGRACNQSGLTSFI